MADTFIGRAPPNDGREWDKQCARCGSSVLWEDCDQCGGEGTDGHDCGDDTCCCLEPDENLDCGGCRGRGGWNVCASSSQWCTGNPIKGREDVERGAIEWFVIGDRRVSSSWAGPHQGEP